MGYGHHMRTNPLYSKSEKKDIQNKIKGDYYLYPLDAWIFEEKYCFEQVSKHFKGEETR